MKRRRLLAALGAGAAGGFAGCGASEEDPPSPAESELRIAVENRDTEAHTIGFLLGITREQTSVVEAFESDEITPGESWTRDPQTLRAGEYNLEITIPGLSMTADVTWIGHDCPVKDVDVEVREDGVRVQTDCPED